MQVYVYHSSGEKERNNITAIDLYKKNLILNSSVKIAFHFISIKTVC